MARFAQFYRGTQSGGGGCVGWVGGGGGSASVYCCTVDTFLVLGGGGLFCCFFFVYFTGFQMDLVICHCMQIFNLVSIWMQIKLVIGSNEHPQSMF